MQIKILVRGYSQEIQWRDEHYVPETINEHLEISRVTVGAFQLACSSFVGMGDIITKEVLDWLLAYPYDSQMILHQQRSFSIFTHVNLYVYSCTLAHLHYFSGIVLHHQIPHDISE
jgi:hypothetical protein